MKKLFLFFALLAVAAVQASPAEENAVLGVNEKVHIRGTLLLPDGVKGPVPLVVIVAGSGPTDRNGNNSRMENNSLKMTAEALAQAGIASLRYDKRGVAGSQVEGLKEEELLFADYIADLDGWVKKYAEDKRFSEIIVLGHSEGSLVGMAVAVENPSVKGFVSVAGMGRSMDKVIKEQVGKQSSQALAMIAPIVDSLKAGKRVDNVSPMFNALFRPSVQPYLISVFRYDPAGIIARLKCPVLVVQGDKDIQVTLADSDALCAALPTARKAVIPGMNHVLKTTDTTDMQAQVIKTYMDPTLPLNKDYVQVLVGFVKNLKNK